MEFSSFLTVVMIFVLSGIFILRPFFVEDETKRKSGSPKMDSLMADKERLLLAIEELDQEFELEKIPSIEHNRNRDILLSEAAEVIKQLDKFQKPSSSKKKTLSPPKADDDLERMITKRRQQLKSEKSQKCPHCGKAVVRGGQFCSHCGEAL